MTVYAYIRVSTDKQTVENQRFEIDRYCARHNLKVDEWVSDDGVSGAKDYKKRGIGGIIDRCAAGDLILCSEISRLGRDLLMIMEILHKVMDKGCKLYTIKDNFTLGDSIQCKVLAFAFGLSAEIERKLISQRTREALARLKSEGKVLGRPKGSKGSYYKCTKYHDQILDLLKADVPMTRIASKCGVHRNTLYRYLVYIGLREPKSEDV